MTALLVAGCVVQWLGATGAAAAAQVEIVAVVASEADREVSLVADVRPAGGAPVRPDSFSVTADGVRVPARAAPVVSSQLAIGLVVDASSDGGEALQAGVNGATNFLLQAPAGARAAVVADTDPPAVVAPLSDRATGAVGALSSVRARGERSTSDALALALRQLPETAGAARLLVLYTNAADAGGQEALDLAERLRKSGALLAVVTTNKSQGYWSRVANATGGLLVAAQPSNALAQFDRVAASLRTRYLVTFPKPNPLPSQVSVVVRTASGTMTGSALVPAGRRGGPPRSEPAAEPGSKLWVLGLGVLAVSVLAVAAPMLNRPRRQRQPGPTKS